MHFDGDLQVFAARDDTDMSLRTSGFGCVLHQVTQPRLGLSLREPVGLVGCPDEADAALDLPPTPVANPGLASLQAAAHPAAVDYLYYVRIPGTKRHFFTASESAFLRKVCEYGYACS